MKENYPAAKPSTQAVTVTAAEAGVRLDRFLTLRLENVSRARVQALIAGGFIVRANGTKITSAQLVKPGEIYHITLPPPDASPLEPEAIALTIVYEDAALIVIDKPAGMVIHPGAGNPHHTLVHALLHHCGPSLTGIGGVGRPGIVHRLDKETSGLLVVAKTAAAHTGLAAQFAARTIERCYRAIVWGVPNMAVGTIDAPIGRHQTQRTKMAIVHGGRTAARHAVTHFKVLRRFQSIAADLECRLETGRTHQIRVHMASLGHPLIGDPVYGLAAKTIAKKPQLGDLHSGHALLTVGRQALHAATLGFQHPVTMKLFRFSSELPDDFSAILAALASLQKAISD